MPPAPASPRCSTATALPAGAALRCSSGARARRAAIHARLAEQAILTRLFETPAGLRFGLPGPETEWARLEAPSPACETRADAALCSPPAPPRWRPFVGAAVAAVDIVDDQGQALRLAQPARRIVSLAPHITELLYAAGAGERVVGAVQYSDYPEAAKKLPRVGGYSAVDMEQVIALKPDLVVAWKSGNRNAHLDKLRALGIPVFINEPRRIDDVAKSLAQFGRLAGTDAAGDAAAKAFRARHAALVARYSARPRLRLFYEPGTAR
jgi:ABC-type Fe3+-hydroxamate transport system substrate-binding protein